MSVVPYREAVASAVRRLGELNDQQTLRRQSEVLSTERVLASDLRRIAGLSLVLGGMVALASIWRTRSLEAATAAHLLQIENSADELRRLSQKLSGAQEDERRNISRELHDEVGQMLTALSMELGNLDEFRHNPGPSFGDHLEQAKRLTEETLRSIRSMSAGLRPSVLDELGLAPALRWQARAFTKSSNIPVEMHLAEDLGDMPDAHLTCIYRVVQEALTNCARHAKAKSIRVTLDSGSGTLSLIVEDDGVGFDVRKARGQGLGLLGIEERVRELGGSVRLESSPGAGTLLRCDIPKPCEVRV
jgi:signal transduction histidine kinase